MGEAEVERSLGELAGREREQRFLERFVDTVSDGAATIVVHGEPGCGKTSLLRWLGAAAGDRDLRVLEAVGIEFERELAFSGLAAILRPLLGHLGALGDTQRAALEAAVGVTAGAAPVLTTYGATLTVLALAAAERPVVVSVDDAQWLDRASLEALVFAAHRAGADRVGFVFAQRAGSPCLLDHTDFDRLELAGVARQAVPALLAPHGVAPQVAERCWELTGGNPLALVEGVRGLTAGQRSGAEPLPPALPVASRLLDTFDARLDGLPDATIRALGLATLEATDDASVVATALSAAGGSVDDLGPAEQRRLVLLADGRVTWRHPLLRSAVYQRLTGPWRRRSHQALAAAAKAAGRDEQALWHLSETIVGPDDGVAGLMADLGAAARRRGALVAAAAAHEQAARLSTETADADGQLLAAGDALWASGELIGTVELLGTRVASASTAEIRARMAMVLGQAEMWTVGTTAGLERFELNAAAVAEGHPALAAELLLHACTARLLALDGDLAVETAMRGMALAERSGDTSALFALTAMDSMCRLLAGAGPEVGERLGPMRELLVAALGAGIEGADDLAQLCGFGFMVCERWAEATDMLELVVRSGETSGMVARSAFARLVLAEVLWRTGRWPESLAELSQSTTLQEAIRPDQVVPGTLALLARVEAGLGQADRCRDHAAAVLGTPPRIEMFRAIAHSAVGLLELGAGRAGEAAAAFDEVAARVRQAGEPGWLWWQGDAVEAYIASGRVGDARLLVDDLDERAATTGRGWAGAAARRGRGMLTQGSDADEHMSAALDGFRAVGSPFEEARTLLARGRGRIRAGEREAGARDVAAARTIFDRLGARSWSAQASALRGETSGVGDALTTRLTPAELRVALAVGRGASNREAAEQLFISTKTVDYHLQSTYRKLGLRSRAQLMTLVLADTGAGAGVASHSRGPARSRPPQNR